MGNFINKEWSQQIDNNSGDDSLNSGNSENANSNTQNQKPKTGNLIKRKISNLVLSASGDQSIEYSRVNSIDSPNSTPITNKLINIDFDPRSPSSGIVRTPICFTDTDEAKKSTNKKLAIVDPRSPTNEYNRTPIHLNTVNMINQNELNQSNNENLNESLSSQESSLLLMSDTSMNMQTVPEYASSNDSPSQQNGLKLASSNLPRHILQRKQVEKLNKKKLNDFKDKENKDKLLN